MTAEYKILNGRVVKAVLGILITLLLIVLIVFTLGNSVEKSQESASAIGSLITNESEFLNIFNTSAADVYTLQNDITLTRLPIYYSSHEFSGEFNGKGYKITIANDLTIEMNHSSNYEYSYGVFPKLRKAYIHDLIVESGDNTITFSTAYSGINANLKNNVGGLVGSIDDNDAPGIFFREQTTLERIIVDINISITNCYSISAGGVVGAIVPASKNTIVKDVVSKGDLHYNSTGYVGAFYRIGGLIGTAAGTISDCAVQGVLNLSDLQRYASMSGIIANFSGASVVNNTYCTNGFKVNTFGSFPLPVNVTRSNCMSFSIMDNINLCTSDENEFKEWALANYYTCSGTATAGGDTIYVANQFVAWRQNLNGGTENVSRPKYTYWQSQFQGVPISANLNDLVRPTFNKTSSYHEIGTDEEFHDAAMGQLISRNFKNLDLRLTGDVKIDEYYVPFTNYTDAIFDGDGYTITVPKDIMIVSLKAGIFANISGSTITDFTFDFQGTFNSATAIDERDKYQGVNKVNGTWNHAALVCYATQSVNNNYEISKIMVKFGGYMITSSLFGNGQSSSNYFENIHAGRNQYKPNGSSQYDNTTARSGALVGEDWHNPDGVTKQPVYENCLIVWENGELIDVSSANYINRGIEDDSRILYIPKRFDYLVNTSAGVYVRLDVGVFWNGSDQHTVGGVSGVWTIVKNNKMTAYNNLQGRGKYVGSAILEMDSNTVNYSWRDGEMKFVSISTNGYFTGFLDRKIEIDEILDPAADVVYLSNRDGMTFTPTMQKETVYYAYQLAIVQLYKRFWKETTVTSKVWDIVQRKYSYFTVRYGDGFDVEEEDNYVFFGFNNIGYNDVGSLEFNRRITPNLIVYADYVYPIQTGTVDYSYNGKAQGIELYDTLSDTVKKITKGEENVLEAVNVGTYIEEITFSRGRVITGVITKNFTIMPKVITVTPLSGQKTDKTNIDTSQLAYTYTNFVDENTYLDGQMEVTEIELRLYEITKGTLEIRDIGTDAISTNYTLNFVDDIIFEQVGKILKLRPTSVLTKVYDGTSDVNIEYVGIDPDNDLQIIGDLENLFSLMGEITIGDNKDVGKYQLEVNNYEFVSTELYTVIVETPAVPYMFEITKKPVTINPIPGQSKAYDNTKNCMIDYTVDGLIAGDTKETSMTGGLSFDGTVGIGIKNIILGSLTSRNYELTCTTGVAFTINTRRLIIEPISGQEKVYDMAQPDEILYSYTNEDGSSYTMPLGNVFLGNLILGEKLVYAEDGLTVTGTIAVTLESKINAGDYYFSLGSLVVNDNYELILSSEKVIYQVVPRDITLIYFKDSVPSVVYTPSNLYYDYPHAEVEGLLEGDEDVQPLFSLEKWTAFSNGDVLEYDWSDYLGVKPNVGLYKATTTGEFTNDNYKFVDGYGTDLNAVKIEYNIIPYLLTKNDFVFEDVSMDFTSKQISLSQAMLNVSAKNYDYDGINFKETSYEDQNNNNNDGMEEGFPKYAGRYKQICIFSYNSNFTTDRTVENGSGGTFTIKRNLTVNKLLLNVTVTFDNSTTNTAVYKGVKVDVVTKAGKIGVLESIDLTTTYTKDGMTADGILSVGNYTISITFSNSDSYYKKNYCLSDGVTSEDYVYLTTFTVTKATPKLENVKATAILYESSVDSSTLSAVVYSASGVKINGGTFTFDDPNVVPDVGTYCANYTYYPSSEYEYQNQAIRYSDNYTIAKGFVYITVNPQVVTVSPIELQTQQYSDGSMPVVAYTNTKIADNSRYVFRGALALEAKEEGAVTADYMCGAYDIVLGSLKIVKINTDRTESDTQNYIINFVSGVVYNITKKEINLSYNGFDSLQYNNAVDATMDFGVSLVGVLESTNESNPLKLKTTYYKLQNYTEWVEITHPLIKTDVDGNETLNNRYMLDAGTYKIVSFIDGKNYVVAEQCKEHSFNVARQTIQSSTFEFEQTVFKYDGTIKSIALKTDNLPTGLNIKYQKNSNVYTGVYTVEIYISSNTKNYIIDTTSIDLRTSFRYDVTVEITKKLIDTIVLDNADTLIYTGDELALAVNFEGIRNEDNVRKILNITQNGQTTKPIKAGRYVLTVEIEENNNYALSEDCDREIEFDIKPAELSIEATTTFVKVFNGKTDMAVSARDFSLKGILKEDNVVLVDGLKANFENEITGKSKKIILSDVVLSGFDASNYTVNLSAIAIVGDITAKRYENTAKASDNFDISIVPIKDSNLDLDATFTANLLDPSDYGKLEKNLLKQKEQVFKMFDYAVCDKDGNKVDLESSVKLSIDAEGSTIKLYKLNADNTLTEIPYEMNNGFIELEVSNYDTYVMTVARSYNSTASVVFSSPFFYAGMGVLVVGFIVFIIIMARKRRIKFK